MTDMIKEHCGGQIHIADNGDLNEEVPATAIVEYSDSKFGGTEKKSLCADCLNVLRQNATVVILETTKLV